MSGVKTAAGVGVFLIGVSVGASTKMLISLAMQDAEHQYSGQRAVRVGRMAAGRTTDKAEIRRLDVDLYFARHTTCAPTKSPTDEQCEAACARQDDPGVYTLGECYCEDDSGRLVKLGETP